MDFNITFNVEFKKIPIVVASCIEESSAGLPIFRIKSVTTSGCIVRVYNNMSGYDIGELKVSWIAMSN